MECIYNDVASISVADEFRHLRKRLRDAERLAIAATSKDARSGHLHATHEDPPGDGRQVGKHATFLERLAAANGANLGEEVYELLQSKPGEVYGACQIYFQSVHKWMPVISQRLFYQRMTEFSKTKRPDFAVLLLSVCLLIRYAATDTGKDPLYKIVKGDFWQLTLSLEVSIELIQAGVLIACYEHAFGMVGAAYRTIGLSARMGSWMGLHNQRLEADFPKDSDVWLENAERYNLWWGIVIRDRCVNIEDTATDKLFAVERHYIPAQLPHDCENLDMFFNAAPVTDAIGIFSRVAQACQLLDRAVHLRQQKATAQLDRVNSEMKRLDNDIRSLLGILIDQNGNTPCEYCEASAIVIAALFVLHGGSSPSGFLPVVPVDIQGNDRILSATASSLALKTAGRIVIDVARSFNRSLGKINMIAIPPTYCYIIFRAAEELISLHDSTNRGQWSQDLEVLREASWHYGRRWQMAAHHLKSVDRSIAKLEPNPPLTFCSFEPLRNHPCLITLFDEDGA